MTQDAGEDAAVLRRGSLSASPHDPRGRIEENPARLKSAHARDRPSERGPDALVWLISRVAVLMTLRQVLGRQVLSCMYPLRGTAIWLLPVVVFCAAQMSSCQASALGERITRPGLDDRQVTVFMTLRRCTSSHAWGGSYIAV